MLPFCCRSDVVISTAGSSGMGFGMSRLELLADRAVKVTPELLLAEVWESGNRNDTKNQWQWMQTLRIVCLGDRVDSITIQNVAFLIPSFTPHSLLIHSSVFVLSCWMKREQAKKNPLPRMQMKQVTKRAYWRLR